MTYRWVDHTGEVELVIEAWSEEEIFADALSAYRELAAGEGEPAARSIALEAGDRADLLARWLEELIYLADAEGFVPERVVEIEVERNSLRAEVAGRAGSASPLVKAVTYHGLQFGFDGERWRAHVVLDV
jgi:SHS2 domain-containing protein